MSTWIPVRTPSSRMFSKWMSEMVALPWRRPLMRGPALSSCSLQHQACERRGRRGPARKVVSKRPLVSAPAVAVGDVGHVVVPDAADGDAV